MIKSFNFKKQPILKICIGTNLLALALILILMSKLPPEVPLFFGNAQGEAQLTRSIFLVLPLVITICFLIVNYLIVKKSKDEFLEKISYGISLILSLLSIVTVLKIFFLVAAFG